MFAEGSHTMNTPPAGIYVCFSALSGVAFCFFSAKTNKLLMPRAGPVSRYYQWNPLGLPRHEQTAHVVTVHGDPDNQ